MGGKTNPVHIPTLPLGIPGLGEGKEQRPFSLLEFAQPVAPLKYRSRATYLLLQLAVSSAQVGLHLQLPRRIFFSPVTLEAFVTCWLISLHGRMPWKKITWAKAHQNFNIWSSGSQGPSGLTKQYVSLKQFFNWEENYTVKSNSQRLKAKKFTLEINLHL